MPKRCVFCGFERRLTNEHVFPQWMSRALNLPPGYELLHTIDMRELGKKARRVKQLDIKVKVVCADCNNGWMTRIEDRVRSIFAPMIRGVPTIVKAEDAKIVSSWITKTALMTAFASPGSGSLVTQEMLTSFYRNQETFPAQASWIGRAEPTSPPTAMQVLPRIMMGRSPASGATFTLYDWMAFVGNLVMRAVIVPQFPWRRDVEFPLKDGAPLLALDGAQDISWPPRGTWVPDQL